MIVNPAKDLVIGLQSREQFYDKLLEMIENGDESPNLGQSIDGEYEMMIFPILGQILQLIEPNEKSEIYEIKLPKNSIIEIALKYDQQNDEGYVFNKFVEEFEWLKFDSENGKILVDITDEIAIKDLVQIEFINQSGELDYQSFVINSRDYDEGTMSETVNPTDPHKDDDHNGDYDSGSGSGGSYGPYGLPVGTEVLSGPINEDITLLSGQIYVLENDVIIGQDLDGTTRRNCY